MKKDFSLAAVDFRERFLSPATTSELSEFLRLLFDPQDYIQIKRQNFVRPADADYVEWMDFNCTAGEFLNEFSSSGIQFCSNALPVKFREQLDFLAQVEAVCKPQWDRMLPKLRDELSLSSSMFERGRTFFIEADNLPTGEPIKTIGDKEFVLAEILKTGVPVSYILDTGGRGPHLGLVLENIVSKADFDRTVRSVMERMPPWIDCGVGRINQLERVPGTRRQNKNGDVVTVKLIHTKDRISNACLNDWIAGSPITNFTLSQKSAYVSTSLSWQVVDPDDAESAAWKFIEENGLNCTKRISNGKIQVACPEAGNHKSGKDSNMSAFINVAAGLVWCSACNTAVGRTFAQQYRLQNLDSSLFPSRAQSKNLPRVKAVKLF